MRTSSGLFVGAIVLCGLLPPTSAMAGNTVVSLTFDDTLADQAQGADLLAARGMRGTFYVNSPRIGQSGFLSLAQLLAMQSAGHEIGGHTANHLWLPSLSSDEQRRQICDDRAALLQLGLQVTDLAYPHGAGDLVTRSIVTACGYDSVRVTSGLRSSTGCPSCPVAETIPPKDALSISAPASIKSNITLADLQRSITDAEDGGGGWVPLVFHHVCDGCSVDAVSPALFAAFLDWLALRTTTGTTVATLQDVIGGPLNAAVPGPVAVAYLGPDGNLLRDASLEDDLDGDHVPDCWQISAGGGDAAAYVSSRTSAAHTGGSAFQFTVVSGLTSAPRLWSQQDLGGCAPPATPGHSYDVSAWYQATDPPIFVAYFRNGAGWWKFLGGSAPLPIAANWARAEWRTPVMPAEATAISIGVSIQLTGTLVLDDLHLVDPAAPSVAPDMAHTVVPDGSVDPVDAATPPDVSDAGTPADAAFAPIDAATPAVDASLAPVAARSMGCALSGFDAGSIPALFGCLLGLALTAIAARRGRSRRSRRPSAGSAAT